MMGNFNTMHPECLGYEVFVRNADEEVFDQLGWSTKRKGKIAYGRSGERLERQFPGFFPVFVNRTEVSERNPRLLAFLDAGEE